MEFIIISYLNFIFHFSFKYSSKNKYIIPVKNIILLTNSKNLSYKKKIYIYITFQFSLSENCFFFLKYFLIKSYLK